MIFNNLQNQNSSLLRFSSLCVTILRQGNKMNAHELHESIVNNTQVSFSRSGGKGGQNVNKVNTKVHLSLPLSFVGGLTDEERLRLRDSVSFRF